MDSQDRRIRTAAGIATLALLSAACGTTVNTAGRFRPAGTGLVAPWSPARSGPGSTSFRWPAPA